MFQINHKSNRTTSFTTGVFIFNIDHILYFILVHYWWLWACLLYCLMEENFSPQYSEIVIIDRR